MLTQNTNRISPDLRLRKCRACGDESMDCKVLWVDSYNVQSNYVCPNCGDETTLAAGGGATGVLLGACLIIAFALSFALAADDGIFDTIDVLRTIVIFAVILFFPIRELAKPRGYPVTGKRELSEAEIALGKSKLAQNAARRPIARLDARKPLYGLAALFLFIAIGLGSAAIFGWVNYTYFDNNIFGKNFLLFKS